MAKKLELTQAQAEQLKSAAATAGATLGRSAYADVVVETAEPNHLSLDLFSSFMPTAQKNKGDQIGRRVRRGRYPIRTMVPGSKHLHDVLSYQEYVTMMFDRLIAGTSHNVWEIRSGEVGTVEQMRSELRADLFDEIVSKVFTLLSTTWTAAATPNNYLDQSGTGVTQVGLDAMIETVEEYSGEVRAIIGSRAALRPIYSFAQFRQFELDGTGVDAVAFPTAAFDEFTRTRRVSTYYGIPLIEMPQVYRNRLPANASSGLRDASQRMIPTDKILVIGGQPGQIVLMDGFEYQDYTDPTTQPANYVLHGWQAYGMVIDDVESIGVIKSNT